MKREKGITLIALIITIIIMLLLLAVTVSVAFGENGLIARAKNAGDKWKQEQENEMALGNGIDWENYVGENIGEDGESNPPSSDVEEIKEAEVATSGGDVAQLAGVIEIAWLDLENNVIANPLEPVADSGMTPLKVDGNSLINATPTEITNGTWYNYTAQTGANDGHTSNWANVKLQDGSYFVWIPRYAYKIIYFDSEEHANYYRINGKTAGFEESWIQGYSTVYGMMDTAKTVITGTNPNITSNDRVKTAGYTDYIPHPAFLGTGYESLGGGFGTTSKGIAGFWMAKFEMSGETSGSSSSPGNVGTSGTIKMVSKPNVSSWRSINIANLYNNAKNYGSLLPTARSSYDSHLIKNSEWGAVAYLTHSRYGRNGIEIRINNNSGYYTGWGASTHDEAPVAYSAGSTNNLWTGQYGLLASTTGNVAGIYDMNGGAYEYPANYNTAYARQGILYGGTTGNTNSSSKPVTGSHFAYTANGESDKYITGYANDTSTYSGSPLVYTVNKTGDGIRETWTSTYHSWFDYSHFVTMDNPYYARSRLVPVFVVLWRILCDRRRPV